ncbi:MAG: DNA gyrase subunit A [Pseudomonadota bacterium]|nr:DNA gyrase subunit A [Pseudomonadota bacterium]
MTDDNTAKTQELLPVSIEAEMKKSYLDYAMSVIVSRAIPDVRDGLKPVHRRILYGMLELGCEYNKPYKKSARIVGDVMGKFHPHGDSAIYDALVRMAQPFSMRLMLVDGQGNFGSMDGDNPAAMRYTESRLSKAAHALLADIRQDTVDWQENYDGSEQEPVVLPAAFPNILVNGAGGIAVGMATNIPPHNLGEVIDACCLYLNNPEVTIDEIMEVCPGPDFPTGGIILGLSGCRSALHTGRGSVIMRAKAEFEEAKSGKQAIIFTEMPYQVNKGKTVEKIGELVREKRIEGIADLRDESDKDGVRVVIEVKKDAVAEIVLNQLYALTPLQSSFGVNMLALDNGRPELMNIKHVITSFIRFREEVITRRTAYLLTKARDRAHVLIGLAIAVANIDEVIAVIKKSANPDIARAELMKRSWPASDVLSLLQLVDDVNNPVESGKIRFTEAQARAILELRLARLTGLEREKIDEEMKELAAEIAEYLSILGSREKLYGILRAELLAAKEQFATPRRTVIEPSEFEADIEDLIQKEDMVVTVTSGGYIKRTQLSAYRAQKRGGKGKSAMDVREEDITTELLVVNTHTPVLFFSNKGQVYKLKVYKLPLGAANTRGKALVNIFPLAEGERITTFMPLPEDESKWDAMHIFFATAKGNVRRNDLSDFHDIRAGGKIAIRMDEGDRLVGVQVCKETDHALLAAKSGKSIRFPINDVRVFKSRTSDGVRGMKLAGGDEVVSISILGGIATTVEERYAYVKMAVAKRRTEGEEGITGDERDEKDETVKEITLTPERFAEMEAAEQFILTVTENGYGKRSSAYEYRTVGRGGSGIVNIITSPRNGKVVASQPVNHKGEIMLMTDRGTVIRCGLGGIRIAGRNTQGVTILKTQPGEKVVSVVTLPEATEEMNGGEEANDNAPDPATSAG